LNFLQNQAFPGLFPADSGYKIRVPQRWTGDDTLVCAVVVG